jgi:hypothetical protein
MEISESEKKKRADFAYLLYDAIYYVLLSIKLEIKVKEKQGKIPTESQNGTVSKRQGKSDRVDNQKSVNEQNTDKNTQDSIRQAEIQKIVDSYRQTLNNRLIDVFGDKPYEPEYVSRLSDEIIDTTTRHPDDDYYLSKERALLIGQNESNTTFNHIDYTEAKESGKRYKVWYAELDDRTREDHIEVDGTRIPIDGMFDVGGEQLRYPHDYLNGSAKNLVNCRCTCRYEW